MKDCKKDKIITYRVSIAEYDFLKDIAGPVKLSKYIRDTLLKEFDNRLVKV